MDDTGAEQQAGTGERAAAEDAARADGRDSSFVAAEREHRLAKLEALRERGVDPYPPRFDLDHTVAEVRSEHGRLGAGEETDDVVRVAGRLMLIRRHGGLIFADLRDRTGALQLLVSREDVGEEAHEEFHRLDLGDWVGAEGAVVATEHGELSVRVRRFQLLSKALRALPNKGRGLTDVDTRYRERYLDLVVNEGSRRTFEIRSATISAVRRLLLERGFREVETPVLDAAAGGAAARPFITHHNALDIDMYMRIALELPLKRLIVGGLERVFEIGRVFRNEGLDTRHNPEFTLLEAYQAYGDYHGMMDLVEAIIEGAAGDALGGTVIRIGDREIDLAPPYRRATMAELISEQAGVEMHPSMPLDDARKVADDLGIHYLDVWGSGKIMAEVYDATGEERLIDPTFVLDHPREVSPLARSHREDPELVERFELVIAGRELANAYSELNDPVDQRQRFESEARLKAGGDEEAEDIDEDYIRALEFGLPPTGGLGIGLDRLVMLLADVSSIREVILFPTMRPEGAHPRPALGGPMTLPRPDSLAAPPSDGGPPEAEEEPAEGEREPGEAPAPPSVAAPAEPAIRRAPARLLAVLTALIGVLSLLPSLPLVRDSLGIDPFLDASARAASHVASVIVGLALLLVARQLARRKRTAWIVAVAAFALGALLHLLKGPDPIAVALGGGMLLALVWWRDDFRAPGDPKSLLTLARFVPLYLGAVLLFGVASLLIASDRVEPSLSVGGILETVFGGLIGLDGPYAYESRIFRDFFPDALLALGIIGLLVIASLLFRPLVQRSGPSAQDRARARRLVRAYGSDTLAYFDLHEGKSYFFSRDGRAMVAYAYMGGYALASSDPVGAPDAIPGVLDEFLAFCRGHGWNVAFLAVRERNASLYEQRGLRSVYLGDEAIIRCDSFTLNGGAMKPVRTAVTHVSKGHRFQLMRESEASPALVERLNEISIRWRGDEQERGFTMELGRDVEGVEEDFLLAIAFDRDERPAGFLRLVPCYGDDPGYSLDLMRREPDSVNGLTEFLIASAALALGERGFRRLSMNFAAWGRLFEEGRSLGPLERLQKAIAEALNPFFQIRSLRDFNQKFQPEWLPRSIVIEDPAAMAKVGVLYASVEGFVHLPVVGRLLVPGVSGDGRGPD